MNVGAGSFPPATASTIASTYVPEIPDIGSKLTASVIASNATGPSVPAITAPTVAVVSSLAAPVNTVLPAISGAAQVGQTLTTTNGTWSKTPTSFAYQWKSAVNVGTSITTHVPVTADRKGALFDYRDECHGSNTAISLPTVAVV